MINGNHQLSSHKAPPQKGYHHGGYVVYGEAHRSALGQIFRVGGFLKIGVQADGK